MSRAQLVLIALLTAAPLFGQGQPVNDPHVNTGLMPGSCSACHAGHGAAQSPMLPGPQHGVCLRCHGTQADRDRTVVHGHLSPDARPTLMVNVLSQPYAHPMSPDVFSRGDITQPTCTSCHSAHRSSTQAPMEETPSGQSRVSPKNPQRFEYELCQDCHGSAGNTTQSLTDISRLFSPENPSYHPLESPAAEASPSVIPALSGHQINCTDCHGNSNPTGPRGPHGSAVPYLLRWRYETTDGGSESPTSYRLCYRCHRREQVLDSPLFPYHREHIVGVKASCATCHNPHGSVNNRALMTFGEETTVAGVSPSISTNELRFESDGPGSGACYLTCHGRDHGPETYGAMRFRLESWGEQSLFKAQPAPAPAKTHRD